MIWVIAVNKNKDYIIFSPKRIRDLDEKMSIKYNRYLFSGINLSDAINMNFMYLQLIFKGYNIIKWIIIPLADNHYKIKIEYYPIKGLGRENYKINKTSIVYLNVDELSEQNIDKPFMF